MDCYPPEFAAVAKQLGHVARMWLHAKAKDDDEAAGKALEKMDQLKSDLKGKDDELTDEVCDQIFAVAKATAAFFICKGLGQEGLDELQEKLDSVVSPPPECLSERLWRKTQVLFKAASKLAVAEFKKDKKEARRLKRKFKRVSRQIAGWGRPQQDCGERPSKRPRADGEDRARALEAVLPSTVIMFSGCQDSQTSADVSNVASFELPEDAGPGGAGGACTNSMIKALSEEGVNYTWASLLKQMRGILEGQYTQIPMLSGSRRMNMNEPYSPLHPEPSGRKRALLVGINYVGTRNELRGCHNDMETMKTYLEQQGFDGGDMRLLMDDGAHDRPTKSNILAGMQWLGEGAGPGDSLFLCYSGHGASVRDEDDDEEDGKDECLVPLDFNDAGLLCDDEAYQHLVAPLPAGAQLVCVFDCCHSGTILDLPYTFKADDQGIAAIEAAAEAEDEAPLEMTPNANFDLGMMMDAAQDHPYLAAGAVAATAGVAGAAYFMMDYNRRDEMSSMFSDILGSSFSDVTGVSGGMGGGGLLGFSGGLGDMAGGGIDGGDLLGVAGSLGGMAGGGLLSCVANLFG